MKLWTAFLNALFPKGVACSACNRETVPDEYGLCPRCSEKIRRYLPMRDFCPEELTGYTAGIMYDGVVPKAVQRFKYNGATHMAGFFAQYMPLPPDWEIDALVPVPLHKRRLKLRGYNQSLLLAEALSERTRVPVRPELLTRTRNTKKQAKLNHEKRVQNVKGAFSAQMDCTGLKLAIVDDVCTTGNTLNECAQALKAAGAAQVYGITACRASGAD